MDLVAAHGGTRQPHGHIHFHNRAPNPVGDEAHLKGSLEEGQAERRGSLVTAGCWLEGECLDSVLPADLGEGEGEGGG